MSTPSNKVGFGGRFMHPLTTLPKVLFSAQAPLAGFGGRFSYPIEVQPVKVQLPIFSEEASSLRNRVVEAEEVTFLSDIVEVLHRLFEWIFGNAAVSVQIRETD